ncbi:hypothetical protein AD930_06760 [Acetobacter malorum]|nr:hypothetical protein AD930_06760 [Acetobacter malorum]
MERRTDSDMYQADEYHHGNAGRRAETSNEGTRLALIAREARIYIPEHIREEDLTLALLLDLLKAQSPAVAWAPPVNKASLGEPPTQYDHHTQMLVERLIY